MIGWPNHFIIRLLCDVNYPKSDIHYKKGTELNATLCETQGYYELTVVVGKRHQVKHLLVPALYCERIGH